MARRPGILPYRAADPGFLPAGNLTLAYSADRGSSYKYAYGHLAQLTAV